MPRTSQTFRTAQDVQDDDTAAECGLVAALDRFQALVWARARNGEISAGELRELTAGIEGLRQVARRSLERNRLVASLLCAVAGGLDPYSERARERLPALRLLPAREPEEDLVA